jgi:site-specific DNA recombinase
MSQPKEKAQSDSGKMINAAIYVRVSTEDQGKGFSIPTQIEACQKLAEREGYTVPDGHVLLDEGISGTTMDRPGLRMLRDLVNSQSITAAVVYDPDRLSRNLGHQLLLAEEFERAGVRLVIVSHPMEQGPEGWLFFQMRGALAEYERAKILERTRRGTVGRIQAGHPWGGGVPLGYRYVSEPHGGRFEIDEEEAALVRRIYAMCLGGMSLRAIARQLTAEGLPTPLERRAVDRTWRRFPAGTWQPTTVRNLLTSETYTGRAAWGKHQNLPHSTRRQRTPESQWISLAIPPIIDAATFQAAKTALTRHKQTATRNRKHDYLFVGARLRCGRCGRGMTGASRRPGGWYYRCNSRYTITDRALRCSGSLHTDVVEQRVWAAIMRVLEQPELIAAEVRRQEASADEQCAEIRRHLGIIEAALAKCDRETQRWADAYAQEVINIAELKGYRAEIEARRRSLQAEYTSGKAKLEAIGQVVQHVEVLTDYCARVHQQLHNFDNTEKRAALEALDIRVIWIPGQPLTIKGSIPVGEIVHSTACRPQYPRISPPRQTA